MSITINGSNNTIATPGGTLDLSTAQLTSNISQYAGNSGGSSTAYTLTPSPAITTYIDGQRFLFTAHATNTSSGSTLAVSGLAALPTTMGSVAMPIGGLVIGNKYWGLVEGGGTAIRVSPYDAMSVNGDTINGVLSSSISMAYPGVTNPGYSIYLSGALGLGLIGKGSSNDITLINNAGGIVAYVPTGTTNFALSGKVGVAGITVPSAYIHTAAGAATAGSAPQKFTAGTFLTTPEAGAVEFDAASNTLSFTPTTVRRAVALSGCPTANTAPTIASGFGTTPSIPANVGSFAFSVNVGTGGVATSGVITMPSATNGWTAHCANNTTAATTYPAVTAQTATSITITNFSRTTGAAVAWAASEVFTVQATAY